VEQAHRMISSGQLKPGDALPSVGNWPQVARIIFTMIANILIWALIANLMKTGNALNYDSIVVALFFFLAFVFRFQAINAFSTIDWMQIKLLKTKRYS
jgi:hypothetical protein